RFFHRLILLSCTCSTKLATELIFLWNSIPARHTRRLIGITNGPASMPSLKISCGTFGSCSTSSFLSQEATKRFGLLIKTASRSLHLTIACGICCKGYPWRHSPRINGRRDLLRFRFRKFIGVEYERKPRHDYFA